MKQGDSKGDEQGESAFQKITLSSEVSEGIEYRAQITRSSTDIISLEK